MTDPGGAPGAGHVEWVESVDGALIASYDFGGIGHPILFAHATGFHAHVWMPVIERLRDDFHCYSFDERGHGASPTPPNGDFDWHRFGDDARATSAAFGLEEPFVVGHSAGGALLLLAEEDHPRSWSAMWTFEPVIPEVLMPAPGHAEGVSPLSAGARKRRSRFDSHDSAYANFASKQPFGHFHPAALECYVRYGFIETADGDVTLACRPEDEAATYDQAFSSRSWDRLGELGLPVHVACGGPGTQIPAHLLRRAVERVPRGSLEVLDGLGHFGPLEDPGRVAASIRTFFGLSAGIG
ncbi:MAG: alpha/beta hydrolase [Acidimicrobiales bacterium]